MPNEDRSIEHLIIEIESKTAKATQNMEKLIAITERLNNAIHAGGFEKLHAQMSKLAALDIGNATNFGNAISAATAKAKGLSDGIGAADNETSSLGRNAEKLASNITHAVDAAKKLEAHMPKAVSGIGNVVLPQSVGDDESFTPLPGNNIQVESFDANSATNFGNAISAATAKAKGLSDGIGAADNKTATLGRNAERLTNNITHAVEAAKKLEAYAPNSRNWEYWRPKKAKYEAPSFGFDMDDQTMKFKGAWYGDHLGRKADFENPYDEDPPWWYYDDDELGTDTWADKKAEWARKAKDFDDALKWKTEHSNASYRYNFDDGGPSVDYEAHIDKDGVARVTSKAEQAAAKFSKISSKIDNIRRNTDSWYRSVKKVEDSTKRTHNSMSSIKTILMYSGLFTLVSTITKGITTGVQNIALASSEANDVLSRYQTLNNQLQNSIGSALIPTLQAAYPLIELLGNGLIGVANALNIVSSAASGKNTFFAANKVAQDYARSLGAVKNALTGFDEINVISPVNQNTYTETPFDAGDVAGSIAKLAMLTAGIVGLRMLTKTIDLAKLLGGLGGLSSLKTGAVLLGIADAAWLAYEAFESFQEGLDWESSIKMIAAVTLGMLLMGKAFGGVGLQVAGLVGGVTLAITGIKSSVTEGINWTNATLTLGGTTLIGAIIGSFFGPLGTLIGAGVGFLVGAFINGGIAIKQNWGSIWPTMQSGFARFGNFFIGAWENIVNFFIKGGNKIAGLLEKLGIGDGKWWDEVSFNRLSVPAYASGGFPEDGLFMANHNELVGSFGGRTAVANNEMIVEGIADGVRDAQSAQNDLIREQNELLRQLLRKSGGTIPVSTIRRALDRQNKRAGRVVVPVGT